jgi:uncharacterized membrane protein
MLAFNVVGIGYIVAVLAIAVLVIFVLFQLAIFLRLRNAELRASANNRTNGSGGSSDERPTDT